MQAASPLAVLDVQWSQVAGRQHRQPPPPPSCLSDADEGVSPVRASIGSAISVSTTRTGSAWVGFDTLGLRERHAQVIDSARSSASSVRNAATWAQLHN